MMTTSPGRIPVRSCSRIIAATHLLNYAPNPVETQIRLAIYTIPPEEVEVKLTPFRLNYSDLQIPANSVSEFTGECDVDAQFQKLLNQPLDLQLYFALPHYHTLGTAFRLSIFGGDRDGESIFELDGYGDPFGYMFDPPIDLSGSKGLRFTCAYDNPRDKVVQYGIGDQEMCVMLGFAASKMAFDSSVGTNEIVKTRSDGIVANSGACDVIAFPFDQNKDGGAP